MGKHKPYLWWALGFLALHGLVGCEEKAFGPLLRILPVDQQGHQLRVEPPPTVSTESPAPPTGGHSALTSPAPGSGTEEKPSPALTPAPLDLMGCEALAVSEAIVLKASAIMGPSAPRLGPQGTTQQAITPEELLGRRYELELTNGAGTVGLQLSKGAGFNVFLNAVVSATITDLNGQVRQIRGQRPNANCGTLMNRFVLSLTQGTYFIRFTGADRVGMAFTLAQN